MKKILGLLCFILVSFIAVSQPTGYPIPQSLGSTNTLVDSKGGTKLRPILYQYPDTATANNDNISRYPFAMIGIKDTVTDSGSIWYRSADTTQWLNIASGGSSSTNAWLIGGNNPASIVRPYLGTTGNKELIFITNNRERLGIPAVGIVQRYTGVEKMLLYDTTTKYMYWHDVYNTQVSSSLCTDTIRYYIGDSLVSQVQVDRQNGLNSGGLVVLSGGTSYFVDSAIYTIACERFSTPQFTVTLSPNTGSSNPRIDVIGLNNLGSGSAFVLEGTPSPNPQTPSVDPAQQIGLVSVYFPANSDTATVINIYNNYVFNGTDSSAIHTVLVSSDSTQMYFCDLYGACDTVELVQTGGAGGGGFKLVLSSSAPADTTVLWASSSINILDCFPIRYYVQGAWSNLDTISGMFYDSVAHSISFGRPITIAATGQSNIVGPPDPSYTYYGDTLTTPLVAAWAHNTSKWKVAKIHSDPFELTNGSNYVIVAAKKISRHFARSVRIVLYASPGTALNCWSGNMGERPDTAACYQALVTRLNASKIKKPDLFVWGQGEAGANGVGADYYTMWVRMLDSLRRQGYMDSTKTITLWMGTADPSGQSINAPSSGGDRGGRRIGNDDDITTIYVPSRGAQQVDPHFTPLGHEQMGERAYTTFMAGVLDPRRQFLGYNTISAYKNTDDSARVAAEGIIFTNAAGKSFIKLFSNDVRYCDANASGITGLRMQRFSNSLSITDYAGGTLNMPGDNKLYWTASGGMDANRFTARTGADPKFILFDAITGLAWNITNLSTTNLFRIDYNGSDRFSIRSTGQIGIGTSSPSNNAAIDAGSTGRGFIPGKLTGAQAEALTLTSGDEGIIFRITNGNGSVITSTGWWGWNGTTWEKLNN